VALAEGRDPEHVAEGIEGHIRTIRIDAESQRRALS